MTAGQPFRHDELEGWRTALTIALFNLKKSVGVLLGATVLLTGAAGMASARPLEMQRFVRTLRTHPVGSS